jgi:hypothetical protein
MLSQLERCTMYVLQNQGSRVHQQVCTGSAQPVYHAIVLAAPTATILLLLLLLLLLLR